MVAIFPNHCLWRRSLCSNLAGIDSEKLYRATFICEYGLFCCMALVSFRLFCKDLGKLQEFFGQMDYRPPWQKIARMPMGPLSRNLLVSKKYTLHEKCHYFEIFHNCSHSKTVNAWVEVVEEGFQKIYSTKVITSYLANRQL